MKSALYGEKIKDSNHCFELNRCLLKSGCVGGAVGKKKLVIGSVKVKL